MNLLSAFGGGLWIIPVGLFLAAAWSAYRGYKSSKSNSTTQFTKGDTGNVPFHKTSGGVMSIILTVIAIIVTIWMYNDR